MAAVGCNRHVFESSGPLSEALAHRILGLADASIAKYGQFTLAVSGGSLPSLLGISLPPLLAQKGHDCSQWHVFYADERCVPWDHPDSNHGLCVDKVLQHLPGFNMKHAYAIDLGLLYDPPKAALEYQLRMTRVFKELGRPVGVPQLDLILLGMGPDGHTCSLFAHHPLTQVTEPGVWVGSIMDSPKPPPSRITLMPIVIQAASCLVAVVTGANKHDVLQEIFQDSSAYYPIAMFQSKLEWYLDQAAWPHL